MIEGTACNDATGCLDATLGWGGAGFGGVGPYRLALYGILPAGLPITLTIQGREEFRDIVGGGTATCPFLETFNYRGSDTQTEGQVFEVTGPISNCLDKDVYHGTLRGHFLDLALTFPFPDPVPEER